MIINSKIKKIGGSYSIIIPAKIVEELELSEDKVLSINILDVVDLSQPNAKFICDECSHEFDGNTEDEDLYCTNCGCEDKEKLKQVFENSNTDAIKLQLIKILKQCVNTKEEYLKLLQEEQELKEKLK